MSGISSARNQAPQHKDLWSPFWHLAADVWTEHPLSLPLSYQQGTLLSKSCCWCCHHQRDDYDGYD